MKILYTLDDTTTFLARSKTPSTIKTISVPIPGQQQVMMMTLGVVSIREVLNILFKSSPELFNSEVDYSIYVKDVTEEDEPFVGHGLVSALSSGAGLAGEPKKEVLIPGRVCSNFTAILNEMSNSTLETLEIKLKLVKILIRNGSNNSSSMSHHHEELKQKEQDLKRINLAKQAAIKKQQELKLKKKEFKKPLKSIEKIEKIERAGRTQSLPSIPKITSTTSNGFNFALPKNSIAHKIYLADKNKSLNLTSANSSSASASESLSIDKRFSDIPSMKKVKRNSISTSSPSASNPASTSATSTTVKKNKSSAPTTPVPIAPIPTIPIISTPSPSCINCGSRTSQSWSWVEDDIKVPGFYCTSCYTNFKKKKKADARKKKKAANSNNNNSNSNNNNSNNNIPSDPPTDIKKLSSEINEFMNSEIDLSFTGPMTDIDPLPQTMLPPQPHSQFTPQPQPATRLETIQIENKENMPPMDNYFNNDMFGSNEPISIKPASRQNSFEKLIEKSINGENLTPSAWMYDMFGEHNGNNDNETEDDNVNEPTPCDFSNMNKPITPIDTVKLDEKPPPSSPMLSNSFESSPNWQLSDSTKLSSMGDNSSIGHGVK